MKILSRCSFTFLVVVVSLVHTNVAGGNLKENLTISLKPTTNSPIKASTCPTASAILPCTCKKTLDGIGIWCEGSAVDQTSVENSLREVRRVNGIPEDRGVDISYFRLENTDLTQFDLAPLYASRIDSLHIQNNGNSKLTKLTTSGNPEHHGSIHVAGFALDDARIDGDTLKYFSVEMIIFFAQNLIINRNDNSNTEEDELLPGLSAFVNLEVLEMSSCNISGRLNSSHFKAFPRLSSIYLYDNKIDGIGENVFHSNVYYINLSYNKLNETSFRPNSGIAQPGRETYLALDSNLITTLPSEIFQPFLDAHPTNYLYLEENPLICDERLSWIKSRREEFKPRVSIAFCRNDYPHTIFTSDLIP